jgi:maltooligosyltrehalose trehalohydrolase
MLVGPGTPMLFQGQEFAASSPFLFFADHEPKLARLVAEGRREFLHQWRALRLPEMEQCFAPPHERATFERSKLDWSERERHRSTWELHRELLRLRRDDPVLSKQEPRGVDGAVLSSDAFVLRFFSAEHGDRLLVINLGRDLHLDPAPEPLLAPLEGFSWRTRFSTEHPRFGGCGTTAPDSEDNWRIPGEAALFLEPGSLDETRTEP